MQNIDVCCIQETHLNNTPDSPSGDMKYTELTEQTDPKVVSTSIPSTEVQRPAKSDMKFITVKLILPDRNLTICNIYCPPNKEINLHILQPNSEDWMIVGDFNSHSPIWHYPSLDAKGEEVEHWIVCNRLVLVNIPTDPPTF